MRAAAMRAAGVARKATSRAAGLTLLELLVVLAIVGALAGVGVGVSLRWRANAALTQGAAEFTRLVAAAQSGARGSGRCVQLSAAGDAVTLRRSGSAVCTALTGAPEVTPLPDGVGIRLTGGSDPMNFVPPYGTTDGSPNEYELSWRANPEQRRTARVTGIFARVIVR